jgi:phage terminase large subunit-like protein
MLDIREAKALLARLKEAPESFSKAELAELDAVLEHVAPARPYISLRDYVTVADPEYRWWWHNEVIAQRCEDLISGRLVPEAGGRPIENLLISCPPRHSKSRTVSELFTSWYMYRFPFRRFGMSSATDVLVSMLSSSAQRFYRQAVSQLLNEKHSTGPAHLWETGHGGYVWATGAGGQATGFGAHCLLSDDPIKNAEQAESPVVRKKTINWFESTWFTRTEPNVKRIVILTRWHEQDPAGYLLRQAELGGEFAIPWHVINFELIRTDDPFEVPANCTLEPDPRPIWNGRPDHEDAVLCAARMPLREALRRKATTSSYYFNALYQGRPKPMDGTLFKVEWFKIVGACPVEVVARVWFFDLAGTDEKADESNDPDFTVGIRMSKGRDGLYYIERMARFRHRPYARNVAMRGELDRDAETFAVGGEPNRYAFRVGFEAESGVEGEDRTRAVTGALAGYQVKNYRPRRSKVSRATIGETIFAESLLSQAEAGNLRLVVAGEPGCPACRPSVPCPTHNWAPRFLDEFRGFPYGAHDDIVDATVGAFEMLVSDPDPFEPPPPMGGDQVTSFALRIG